MSPHGRGSTMMNAPESRLLILPFSATYVLARALFSPESRCWRDFSVVNRCTSHCSALPIWKRSCGSRSHPWWVIGLINFTQIAETFPAQPRPCVCTLVDRTSCNRGDTSGLLIVQRRDSASDRFEACCIGLRRITILGVTVATSRHASTVS